MIARCLASWPVGCCEARVAADFQSGYGRNEAGNPGERSGSQFGECSAAKPGQYCCPSRSALAGCASYSGIQARHTRSRRSRLPRSEPGRRRLAAEDWWDDVRRAEAGRAHAARASRAAEPACRPGPRTRRARARGRGAIVAVPHLDLDASATPPAPEPERYLSAAARREWVNQGRIALDFNL